jgi:hypothetical protein
LSSRKKIPNDSSSDLARFTGGDDPDLLSAPGRTPPEKAIEDVQQELDEQLELLKNLKRQQEEIEQRKNELMELARRRAELTTGQKRMREHFTRGITLLERAEYVSERQIEEIRTAKKTFQDHLASVEAINPKAWEPDDVDEELTRALSKIDNAQAVYSQSRAKISALSGQEVEPASPEDGGDAEGWDSAAAVPFAELVWRGFALTLPLILVLAAIAAAILYSLRN